jgi:predicted DNA-binding WGR domain protein
VSETPRLRFLGRIRPEDDERRWYAIVWGPTLCDTWAVHLSWGRLGTERYRQRILEFDTPEAADAEAETQVERRLQRGYGPVQEK